MTLHQMSARSAILGVIRDNPGLSRDDVIKRIPSTLRFDGLLIFNDLVGNDFVDINEGFYLPKDALRFSVQMRFYAP